MEVVVYRSKYGHTRQYAEWLAAKRDCEVVPLNKLRRKQIEAHDTVIFGTGVYLGKMKGLKKVLRRCKDKTLVLFACGGSIDDPAHEAIIVRQNLNGIEHPNLTFFYVPGGIDLSKVKGPMRPFMSIARWMISRKKNKSQDELEFLKGFEAPTYYVSEEHLDPLLNHLEKAE